MTKTFKSFLFLTLALSALQSVVIAGNEDRAGQAGATELLINPWARSAGWGGANSANSVGAEAAFMNVAGIAFTEKTEFAFTNTSWLKGTDVSINSFALTQKMGESSVIGLSMMSVGFGDIPVTTTDLPEGNGARFSPRLMNLGLAYSKAFSSSIYGGLNLKVVSEGISNASAQGIALDAGIQYVTGLGVAKDGKKNTNNVRFGIALKNVGPPIRYSGDGLSFKGVVLATGTNLTVQHRAERFELPSLVNIGAAYDYKVIDPLNLTFAGTFTSNSFSRDAFQFGVEANYLNYFMLRLGYNQEAKSKSQYFSDLQHAYAGPTAGFSLNLPLGKEGTSRSFALDYSVRFTNVFDNIHSIGARINL